MSQTAPAPPPPPPARRPAGGEGARRGWVDQLVTAVRPTWSTTAAFRAARATLVIPSVFALSSQVLHNEQMALFATFGGFASLVMATFGGSRRDKAIAFAVMGTVGSALLTAGTAVNGTTALAAVVTLVVAFAVLFAGVAGPNAASGATAVLLSYVLPAASPGDVAMIPSRLAGWWLAVGVSTLAVLVLSPRSPGDRVGAAASRSAASLSELLDALSAGRGPQEALEVADGSRAALEAAFTAVPYRPTGLADADQSLARLVEGLEWTTDLAEDLGGEPQLVTTMTPASRHLLEQASRALRDTATMLDGSLTSLTFAALDAASGASWDELSSTGGPGGTGQEVHGAFHAQMISTAARGVAVDALGASRRPGDRGVRRPWSPVRAAWDLVRGHASVRSVWLRNSARGAVALAGAVAVADLTDVQHGFWVVLGALAVLRTNAGATGATALRGIVGTAVGFFVGAGVVLGIGVGSSALWAAFPLAVLVAAYTPGTAPFAAGQAAFTVLLSVLYNVIVPVGWTVGALRLEDVTLGAGVSVIAGLLFWPRGAVSVVADDLADAYHTGGVVLAQSTSWAVGTRTSPPDPRPAERSAERLEDALRAMLTEQGTKRLPKEQLWSLVAGSVRLRLSALSLSRLAGAAPVPEATRRELVLDAVELAGRCDDLATTLGRPQPTAVRELTAQRSHAPPRTPAPSPSAPTAVLVRHLLDHVRTGLSRMAEPARALGARRTVAWWR